MAATPLVLNCRISADLDELESLHRISKWTPSRENIRPIAEVRAAKDVFLASVCNSYEREADYVYHTVFSLAPDFTADGRMTFADKQIPRRKVLQRNEFPYELPPGTRHFIMWYTYTIAYDTPQGEKEISADIDEALAQRTGTRDGFSFVWYMNPKMTIPSVFHVQVFWTSVSRPSHRAGPWT